jgi:RNA polymerase sigma-70 factor (ECF subfamily)
METSPSLLDRLCTAPDEAAWRRLHDLYRPFVLAWVRRDATLGAEAEDLVQEVMTVLVRELPTFQRRRTGSFRRWLREITRRRLQGYYRKRRRQPQASGEAFDQLQDPNSALSRQWDEEHDRHVLTRLLDLIAPQFGEKTLLAFRRLVFDEVPAAEVGTQLGMSVNAVLLAKSHVLRELRREAEGLID